jgi:anti-sigma factor RsiW
MHDEWTDRLSAYVDEELSADDRAALERHLATCEACRGAVAQLGSVKSWAANYQGQPPRVDVWPRIEEEIRERTGAHRVVRRGRVFRIPHVAAAGIALAVVAGGSWWLGRASAPASELPPVVGSFQPAAGRASETAVLAAERYTAAIVQLEQALLEEDGLDSVTVRVLQDKLLVIDRAIAEAREALARDPNSAYLADHYAGMMRTKLTLLRNAAAMAGYRRS